MNLGSIAARVQAGETVRFRPSGNSMRPHILPGENVEVRPIGKTGSVRGQIVLAKVRGRWYLHFARSERDGQVQIANASGHVNGWTSRTNVVGVAKALR